MTRVWSVESFERGSRETRVERHTSMFNQISKACFSFDRGYICLPLTNTLTGIAIDAAVFTE